LDLQTQAKPPKEIFKQHFSCTALFIYSALNVQITFGTVCLLTVTFHHLYVLFCQILTYNRCIILVNMFLGLGLDSTGSHQSNFWLLTVPPYCLFTVFYILIFCANKWQ